MLSCFLGKHIVSLKRICLLQGADSVLLDGFFVGTLVATLGTWCLGKLLRVNFLDVGDVSIWYKWVKSWVRFWLRFLLLKRGLNHISFRRVAAGTTNRSAEGPNRVPYESAKIFRLALPPFYLAGLFSFFWGFQLMHGLPELLLHFLPFSLSLVPYSFNFPLSLFDFFLIRLPLLDKFLLLLLHQLLQVVGHCDLESNWLFLVINLLLLLSKLLLRFSEGACEAWLLSFQFLQFLLVLELLLGYLQLCFIQGVFQLFDILLELLV